MILVMGFWTFVRAVLFGSAAIALENLALRHQLLVLQRSVGRPRLSRWDRVFWVWLSRVWASWRSSLVIVQPATVLAWHRQGFRLYWRWKSRPSRSAARGLTPRSASLIRRMARENPTWGRRRGRCSSTSCPALMAQSGTPTRNSGRCSIRRSMSRHGSPYEPRNGLYASHTGVAQGEGASCRLQ